mgnify:CR=1 FL=1
MYELTLNMLVILMEETKYNKLLELSTEIKSTIENVEIIKNSLNIVPVSIFITDTSGTILWSNDYFKELSGWGDEIIGKTPRVLKSGFHDEEFYKDMWTKLLSGESYKGTVINKNKNGELKKQSTTISPVFDVNKKITHFIAINLDIAE